MKKIILIIVLLFSFFSVSASAEEVKYENLITDSTTIEEDFKLLKIDIKDYHKPTKYRYEKWYVIAMSEGYKDTESFEIQTYFYLYNPSEYGAKDNYMSTVASLYLNYKLKESEEEVKDYSCQKLEYNKEHLIYKVKGFSYAFTERKEIYITGIRHVNFYGEGIKSDSSFKAVANHSKLNGLSIELAFNSTLIIDEMECVSLDVLAENNFSNWFFGNVSFQEMFIDKIVDKKLRLYFYNFNFPDSIKPDSIDYAKFSYFKENWVKEEKRVNTGWSWKWEFVSDSKKSEEDVLSEYVPGTHKFQVGNSSEELQFETFVLGNRIEKEDHGYLTFTDDQKKHFNYDCSILLDSDYTIIRQYTKPSNLEGRPDNQYTSYTKLRDIDFIELWYKKDGVVYKCQVASPTIPGDDNIGDVGSEASWWENIWGYMVKFGDIVLKACNLGGAPDLVKGIVGSILSFLSLIVGIVLIIVLLPYLIKFLIWIITLPIKLVQNILKL